jgi:hypothetical protein
MHHAPSAPTPQPFALELRDLLVRVPQGDDIARVTLTVAPGAVTFVQGQRSPG